MRLGRHLPLAALALAALAATPPAPGAGPDGEPRPERLGTPEMSAAAIPAWESRAARQLLPGQVPYAPGSEDAQALYDQADARPSKAGPLRDVALACSVDFGARKFDEYLPFADPDMVLGDLCAVAGVAAGGRPLRHVILTYGPDDTNTLTFLVPLVSLDPGQALVVRLIDVDLQFDDAIDLVRAPYRGALPLSLSQGGLKGDCRLVSREALEATLPEHLKATDAALAEARREFKASLDDPRPQSVDAALSGAQRTLADAAALVGWDDPRVVSRVARIAALDRELSAEWSREFESARSQATGKEWTTVAEGQLEVRVAGLRCGAGLSAYAGMNLPSLRAKDACALNLGVRNKTDRPLAFDFRLLEPLGDLLLVDGRGNSRDAHFEGAWKKGRAAALPEGSTLAPGQEAEYVVGPDLVDGVLKKSRLPLLLRGRHSARASSLAPASVELLGGAVAAEVVEYLCGGERLASLSETAWVPSWRRPVCGLRLRLQSRAASATPFKSLKLREISLLGRAGRKTTSEGLVLLEPTPRAPRTEEALPAGGKVDVMLLFSQKEAPASLSELRLALPCAKGYFFLLVDGS